MPVAVWFDAGSGLTGVSERVCVALTKHCLGTEITLPYAGGMQAKMGDGRVFEIRRQTCPMKLTTQAKWSDVGLTTYCVVFPHDEYVFVLGANTLRDDLDINMGYLLKDIFLQLGGRIGTGSESRPVTLWARDDNNNHNMKTQHRAAKPTRFSGHVPGVRNTWPQGAIAWC